MAAAHKRKLFGQIVAEMGLCKKSQIIKALEHQKQAGGKIGEILVGMGLLTEEDVIRVVARQLDMDIALTEEDLKVSPDVVKLLPAFAAKKYRAIPLDKSGATVHVAMEDPFDIEATDNLRFIFNADLKVSLAIRTNIDRALVLFYGEGQDMSELMKEVAEDGASGDETGVVRDRTEQGEDVNDSDAPVIRFVHYMFREALKMRASDIHAECFPNRVRIRFRIDGVLREVDSPPKRMQQSLIARLKIMARLDIAEKRKPQDGRIKLALASRQIDVRVSTLPSIYGESVVMRLLDRENVKVGIEALGFDAEDLVRFERIIKKPNGVFLVTGPTGSGKTTTLYAALNTLNRPDVKIITAEDPVEYNISGMNQVEVRTKIGLTFESIIRTMLRQAPDIILVGEIRDLTTAEAAVMAALTGHLVFSTLHTNDAPSSIVRLNDMGVKRFLISSAVQAIMAQRLVRVICDHCKEKVEPDRRLALALGIAHDDIDSHAFYAGAGCEFCNQTGYRGRKGIFELMEMTSTIREMVFEGASTYEIREQARLSGMVTLKEDAIRKVFSGMTTLQEVVRVTAGDVSFVGQTAATA